MDNLVNEFSINTLLNFFKAKVSSFKPLRENLNYILSDNNFQAFSELNKVGEIDFNGVEDLLVFACKTDNTLTERSSKKQQFEIAKKALKKDAKDGAIFVFYDATGNFRFSFIRKNYGNKEQKFTNWKRFTYYVEKDKTNKTFKDRVGNCDFSSLDAIQKAFSVEPLNEEFYENIAKAFYSLIGGKTKQGRREIEYSASLKLPSISPEDNAETYQRFAVRLIGRIIFIWFLKKKKSINNIPLVPEDWLSSVRVGELDQKEINYYHDVLEKLFFLMLNKQHKERSAYELPEGHETIPFLNGGLFDVHTTDYFPTNNKGIHQIQYNLVVPNQ